MTQERTRRLAAVWFADIVGYTDLASRDEDLALSVVRELQRLTRMQCDAHTGRLVKTLGDGVLAVFDSADGAVRAAIGLRDAFLVSTEVRTAGDSLRVGLHLGDVSESPDGDVYGDAVNAASGIAELAEPGQVVISAVAYQLLHQRATLEVEDLGSHELKGLGKTQLYAAAISGVGDGLDLRGLLQEELAPLQVLDEAGFGGMGAIYLVRDPRLRRTLAVKVLREELVADRQARARFFREAQVIAGLAHPNVVTIHNVGELKDGTPYFVMDYVEGGSLADRVAREGPLPVREVRRIIGEVASALSAAHEKGVVHRDIKASNILYDPSTGRSLVTDWGIAALNTATDLQPEDRLTQTGAVVGSPRYMSPEQLAGDDVGSGSDVYSLGLLAYELLTGDGPFAAKTPRELMIAHLREDPPRLAEVREGVDPEFDSAIARCLEKDAPKRISAVELAERFAPRAEAVLEWPPPGLGLLQGELFTIMVSVGVVVLGVAAPVVSTMMIRAGRAPLLEDLLVGRTGVSVMMGGVFGLYVLGGGAFWLIGGLRKNVVVKRLDTKAPLKQMLTDPVWSLGYGWRTMLEVGSDRWGDVGNLLSGQREYAVVDAETRGRIRRRIGRRALIMFFSLALLPAGTIGATVAISTGTLSLPVAAGLFIGGPFLIWLAALVIPVDPREVRTARRGLTEGLVGDVALKSEAEAWRDSLAKATEGTGVSEGRATSQRMFWTYQVGQIVFGLPVMYMIVVLMALAISSDAALPRLGDQMGFSRVLAASHLALESDGRTSRVEAPALLAVAGDPGPNGASRAAVPEGFATIIARAFTGLSEEDVEALEVLGGDPRGELFERLGRADGLGPGPPDAYPPSMLYGDHEPRRFPELPAVARSRIARAALLVNDGDNAAAEVVLREVYSVGRMLVVDSNALEEATLGLRVATMAMSALEQLYLATGGYEEVESWRNQSTPVPPAGWREWKDRARELIADTTQVRSMRIATIYELSVAMECRDLTGLLLGPPPDVEAELQAAAMSLERTEADRAFIAMATSASDRVRRVGSEDIEALGEDTVDPWVYNGLRLVGRVAGNPRMASCSVLSGR